jgi:hypothetical protein
LIEDDEGENEGDASDIAAIVVGANVDVLEEGFDEEIDC